MAGFHRIPKAPCANCPFRKTGGITLTPGRISELARGAGGGREFSFSCHKTMDYSGDEPQETSNTKLCAGSLAYSKKQGHTTKAMAVLRILGLLDIDEVETQDVWDGEDEWIENNSTATRSNAVTITVESTPESTPEPFIGAGRPPDQRPRSGSLSALRALAERERYSRGDQ